MYKIPRPEHPNPQWQRETWLNLNGIWQFEVDSVASGIARGLFRDTIPLSQNILVPFCPESRLSGIEHKDFLRGIWYKRWFTLSEEQAAGRVVLHFGAVDYLCTVFINEQQAGSHQGGFSSFCLDITDRIHAGENSVAVFAFDDTADSSTPSGKQSGQYSSYGCYYTRSTGIWQTVWLEFTPTQYIDSAKYYPDSQTGTVVVEAHVVGCGQLTVDASYQGKPVGAVSLNTNGGRTRLVLPLTEIHLWEPGYGRLYDLTLAFGPDRVNSYVGLRNVRMDDHRFLINERSVFQRFVLDQGLYPDSIYTAPDDNALQQDIRIAMDMGFNGARLHEKVFEERFLYHCDRMGYMVWGEYPDWGVDNSIAANVYRELPEWMEVLERDFNHPAIIGWCPHNEVWDSPSHRAPDAEAIRTTYLVTKAIDPTRPCIDTSGGFHVQTDIFDVHDYQHDVELFSSRYNPMASGGEAFCTWPERQQYHGEPYYVSEFGGITWSNDNNTWGYGAMPESPKAFLEKFRGLCHVLMDNPRIFGFCYTQLTDVEQEQNGLCTPRREPKFNVLDIRQTLKRPAAIENE